VKDVEYVKELLRSEYATEREHEIPYPSLATVVQEQEFSFEEGVVAGEVSFGSENRDGKQYLKFESGDKSIYTHRFIVSYALGRWMPRECDVDHINHDPTDNRPSNLRIVTPRDNANNRRKALLSELVDLDCVKEKQREAVPEDVVVPDTDPELEPEPQKTEIPTNSFDVSKVPMSSGPIPVTRFTGETKPADYAGAYGGVWYKTNLDTWHLLFEPPADLRR
jgi:hypothetical protein